MYRRFNHYSFCSFYMNITSMNQVAFCVKSMHSDLNIKLPCDNLSQRFSQASNGHNLCAHIPTFDLHFVMNTFWLYR